MPRKSAERMPTHAPTERPADVLVHHHHTHGTQEHQHHHHNEGAGERETHDERPHHEAMRNAGRNTPTTAERDASYTQGRTPIKSRPYG